MLKSYKYKYILEIFILLFILLVGLVFYFIKQKYYEGMENTSVKYLNGIDVIYWINLDRSVDRKMNMERFLTDDAFKGIPTKRITAFDGKKDANKVMTHFKLDSIMQTDTEYACLLSHLEAIRTFNDSKYDVALIFEDDATLEFKKYWEKSAKQIMDNAPPDWEILLVSYMYAELNPLLPFYDWASTDTEYDSTYHKYYSALSYIINKKGANKVINSTYSNGKYNLKSNIAQVSDVYIFGITNSYTYKYPMFVYNTDLESTIHQNHIPFHILSKQHLIKNYQNYEKEKGKNEILKIMH
jgi:GR25 family glycosyltransferase involved in LPS biosynthesis